MDKQTQIYQEGHIMMEQMLQLGKFLVGHHHGDYEESEFYFIRLDHGNLIGEFRYRDASFYHPVKPLISVHDDKIKIRPFYSSGGSFDFDDIWDYPTHPGLAEYALFSLRIYKKTWTDKKPAMWFRFIPEDLGVIISADDLYMRPYPDVNEIDLDEILEWLADIRGNLDKTWVTLSGHPGNTGYDPANQYQNETLVLSQN